MADDDTLSGPGLAPRNGADPVLATALLFAILCLVPTFWFRFAFGVHAFGPLAFPAILAIVAVLFGMLALLRGVELKDTQMQRLAMLGAGVGLVRLLLYPLLGW